MSDFVATHRSKGGVGIQLLHNHHSYDVVAVLCTAREFDALFEPIPKPVMVLIPLDVARRILKHVGPTGVGSDALYIAIDAAEREAKENDGN